MPAAHRSVLAGLLSFLLCASACRHAEPAAPAQAAAAADDSAAVQAVFGKDSGPAPTKAGPASPWEKKFEVPGQPGKLKVFLSYEDRAIAEADGRIYEAFDPFKLPAGVYTWIVTPEGTTSFGRPLDAWEIGTRHAHVAQRRLVVAAGELHTDGRAKIRVNTLSGTYALPMIKEGKWTSDELRKRSARWFDEVLRRRHSAPKEFAVEEATLAGKDAPIFDVVLEPPGLPAIRKLCAAPAFLGNNPVLCAAVREKAARSTPSSWLPAFSAAP